MKGGKEWQIRTKSKQLKPRTQPVPGQASRIRQESSEQDRGEHKVEAFNLESNRLLDVGYGPSADLNKQKNTEKMFDRSMLMCQKTGAHFKLGELGLSLLTVHRMRAIHEPGDPPLIKPLAITSNLA